MMEIVHKSSDMHAQCMQASEWTSEKPTNQPRLFLRSAFMPQQHFGVRRKGEAMHDDLH